MKKNSFRWLAVMLAMVFVLAGCGASASKESAAYDSAAPMVEEAPAEEWKGDDMVWEEEAIEEEAAATTEQAASAEKPASNRKLIKRYYIDLETREYEELIDYIQKSVEASGGYIESSNMSGTSIDGYGSRNAYFVLRVPVKDAANFITGLEENGHMTHKSEEVEDVTLAYVDTQSRLQSLRVEQEALMEMLEQATDLDTLFAIQSRLTDVRYQLESYESQLRTYDNLVDYTTITVDVYEVQRETVIDDGTFGSRLREEVSESLENFADGAERLIIWIIAAFPYWIILGIIAAAIVFGVRASHKRYWKKKELEAALKSQKMDAESAEKPQEISLESEKKEE